MNRNQEGGDVLASLCSLQSGLSQIKAKKDESRKRCCRSTPHTPHAPHQTGQRRGTPPAGTLSPPNTCMLEPNGPVGGSKPAPESMSVQVEATPTPTGEERRPHAGGGGAAPRTRRGPGDPRCPVRQRRGGAAGPQDDKKGGGGVKKQTRHK